MNAVILMIRYIRTNEIDVFRKTGKLFPLLIHLYLDNLGRVLCTETGEKTFLRLLL